MFFEHLIRRKLQACGGGVRETRQWEPTSCRAFFSFFFLSFFSLLFDRRNLCLSDLLNESSKLVFFSFHLFLAISSSFKWGSERRTEGSARLRYGVTDQEEGDIRK